MVREASLFSLYYIPFEKFRFSLFPFSSDTGPGSDDGMGELLLAISKVSSLRLFSTLRFYATGGACRLISYQVSNSTTDINEL